VGVLKGSPQRYPNMKQHNSIYPVHHSLMIKAKKASEFIISITTKALSVVTISQAEIFPSYNPNNMKINSKIILFFLLCCSSGHRSKNKTGLKVVIGQLSSNILPSQELHINLLAPDFYI